MELVFVTASFCIFSNVFNCCFDIFVHVSHPYNILGISIVSISFRVIYIFLFFESWLINKKFNFISDSHCSVACWPGGGRGATAPLRVKYEGRQNDNLKTWAPKVPFF